MAARRRSPLAFALVLAVTPLHAGAINAPPLPPQVMELVAEPQGARRRRTHVLRHLGLRRLLLEPDRGWSQDGPFALDLHYHRALDGAKIAERSVSEIAKLGYGTTEQRARWGREMSRMFPDVRRGDRLTGVNLPGGVVRYFYNGKSIGDIADPGFARAFFGIWLDPKSSQLDFRQLLLGEKR